MIDDDTKQLLQGRARRLVLAGHDDTLEGAWEMEPVKDHTSAEEANQLLRYVAFLAADARGEVADDGWMLDFQLRAVALIEAEVRGDEDAARLLTPTSAAEARLLIGALAGIAVGLVQTQWPGREVSRLGQLRQELIEQSNGGGQDD